MNTAPAHRTLPAQRRPGTKVPDAGRGFGLDDPQVKAAHARHRADPLDEAPEFLSGRPGQIVGQPLEPHAFQRGA
jgi:hypothetical protein